MIQEQEGTGASDLDGGRLSIFSEDPMAPKGSYRGTSSSMDQGDLKELPPGTPNMDQKPGISDDLLATSIHAKKKAEKSLAKTSLRLRYEAERKVIEEQIGSLETVRQNLGLSRRKVCQLLLVDPSAWSRWTRTLNSAPPHVYRALQWYLLLQEKDPSLNYRLWLSGVGQDRRPPELLDWQRKMERRQAEAELLILEKEALVRQLLDQQQIKSQQRAPLLPWGLGEKLRSGDLAHFVMGLLGGLLLALWFY